MDGLLDLLIDVDDVGICVLLRAGPAIVLPLDPHRSLQPISTRLRLALDQAVAGKGLNAYGGGVHSQGGALVIAGGSSIADNKALGRAGVHGAKATGANNPNGGTGGADSGGGV